MSETLILFIISALLWVASALNLYLFRVHDKEVRRLSSQLADLAKRVYDNSSDSLKQSRELVVIWVAIKKLESGTLKKRGRPRKEEVGGTDDNI